MERKGQAAMEFLMTYGWAILAAIIAIVVLASFGVFSPGKLTGNIEAISQPFAIRVANVVNTGTNDGTVNLDIIQNSGETINNVITTVKGTGSMAGTDCTSAEIDSWNSGAVQTVAIDCTDGTAADTIATGGSFAADITIRYNKGTSTINQQSTGNIKHTVQ